MLFSPLTQVTLCHPDQSLCLLEPAGCSAPFFPHLYNAKNDPCPALLNALRSRDKRGWKISNQSLHALKREGWSSGEPEMGEDRPAQFAQLSLTCLVAGANWRMLTSGLSSCLSPRHFTAMPACYMIGIPLNNKLQTE